MRVLPAVFGLAVLLVTPGLLVAKGYTAKITIKGPGLSKALDITDREGGSFPLWAGPGVHGNGAEETEGFIIDWPKGIVPQPQANLGRYEVSYYSAGHTQDTRAPTLPSVV